MREAFSASPRHCLVFSNGLAGEVNALRPGAGSVCPGHSGGVTERRERQGLWPYMDLGGPGTLLL